MAQSKSNRFTWKKPVVKPLKAVKSSMEHRLKNHSEVKPSVTNIKEEYDAFVKRRRGQA